MPQNQFDLSLSIFSYTQHYTTSIILFYLCVLNINICLCVPAYGQGYAWSPASLTVFVGDTVMWRWEAPAFQNVGYRVFSVPSPSGSTYEGGPLNSGNTKTAKGKILSDQQK